MIGGDCSGASFASPKSRILAWTELSHKNVGGLDVAVNDALGVSGIESPGDVNCQFEQLFRGKRPAQNALAQRHPFQQFHHDEILTLLLADLVDGANVRVVERRSGASLALETFQGRGIRAEFGRKKLQRYVPAEGFVLGLVDNAHSTTAQFLDDAVVRDGLADHMSKDAMAETGASQ